MLQMLKVYADPITVNCRKVLAGLDLIGAPFELNFVDYFKAEQKSPEFTKINPMQALPAAVDGDLVLWESNAILQYAADTSGNEAVYPRDLKVRADINRWLLWESSSWFPSCYTYLVENCVKPVLGAQPDPAVLEAQSGQFNKLAAILETRLTGRDWLSTSGPSIADIAVAAPMHLHGWQQLPLAAYPNLKRWMTKNVEGLPSWQKTTVYEGFTTKKPA
jgi:glutathione S-transferase